MFRLLHDGIIIGYSALDDLIPKACGAEGEFYPVATYADFKANTPPDAPPENESMVWSGLILAAPDGEVLACDDLRLIDDAEGCWVDAMYIEGDRYREIFADQIKDLEEKLRDHARHWAQLGLDSIPEPSVH